ncbi:hypothetical protein VVS222_00674 [Vibrio vulnificus]|nr:hypothetical protein VVS222_00674 [Vibrio vulnificus]
MKVKSALSILIGESASLLPRTTAISSLTLTTSGTIRLGISSLARLPARSVTVAFNCHSKLASNVERSILSNDQLPAASTWVSASTVFTPSVMATKTGCPASAPVVVPCKAVSAPDLKSMICRPVKVSISMVGKVVSSPALLVATAGLPATSFVTANTRKSPSAN